MAKAMEDRTMLPIILRAMLVVYACLRSGNKTFSLPPWGTVCPLRDKCMNKTSN